jgi:hypothetical protein
MRGKYLNIFGECAERIYGEDAERLLAYLENTPRDVKV